VALPDDPPPAGVPPEEEELVPAPGDEHATRRKAPT
jgi:hypothetical protein